MILLCWGADEEGFCRFSNTTMKAPLAAPARSVNTTSVYGPRIDFGSFQFNDG